MSRTIDKGKASDAEREKLIEEMKELIKEKRLDVSLSIDRPVSPVLMGCATCTVCPCMICW